MMSYQKLNASDPEVELEENIDPLSESYDPHLTTLKEPNSPEIAAEDDGNASELGVSSSPGETDECGEEEVMTEAGEEIADSHNSEEWHSESSSASLVDPVASIEEEESDKSSCEYSLSAGKWNKSAASSTTPSFDRNNDPSRPYPDPNLGGWDCPSAEPFFINMPETNEPLSAANAPTESLHSLPTYGVSAPAINSRDIAQDGTAADSSPLAPAPGASAPCGIEGVVQPEPRMGSQTTPRITDGLEMHLRRLGTEIDGIRGELRNADCKLEVLRYFSQVTFTAVVGFIIIFYFHVNDKEKHPELNS